MTHSSNREMRRRLFERARSTPLTVAQLQDEFPFWACETITRLLRAERIKALPKTHMTSLLKGRMLNRAPHVTLDQLHKEFPYWARDTVRVYVATAGLKCIRKNAVTPCPKSPPSSSPR